MFFLQRHKVFCRLIFQGKHHKIFFLFIRLRYYHQQKNAKIFIIRTKTNVNLSEPQGSFFIS
ncbi:hypothetical protein QFZ80_002683 [Paenibacillus sp. V4I7]|nr:hypothetical protein [Paenibacillus sp. V4I7]